jgi:hypothetical protein
LSKIEVNTVEPQCGTTLTLGASGDTVTLGSGASQSGFGRTGTVNWDTTAKTASFTAVSGNGYFVNTTSGAITVTLPASPSAGDIVAVADYAGTAATNNITIGRNSSNIEGLAENGTINNNRDSITLVYVDGTQGWLAVNDNESSFIAPSFVTATGGTITTSGNFKIHTFTGPGTFTVSCAGNAAGSNTVSYLVVAGGGGGGSGNTSSQWGGGGGGAGGYRESKAASDCYSASPLNATSGPTYNLPVTAQGYPITVGGGGGGGTAPGDVGCSGANSIFSSITAAGGGGGGKRCLSAGPGGALNGGSGGGGGSADSGGTGGTGNTPPVSPPQGKDGGDCITFAGGGGGGAGAAGTDGGPESGACAAGGPGGNGVTSSINASPVTRAGGGGGANAGPDAGSRGTGGSGGGGAQGAPGTGTPSGGNGTVNTGGGGGAGGGRVPTGTGGNGGSGGSGIVIIRYKFQ